MSDRYCCLPVCCRYDCAHRCSWSLQVVVPPAAGQQLLPEGGLTVVSMLFLRQVATVLLALGLVVDVHVPLYYPVLTHYYELDYRPFVFPVEVATDVAGGIHHGCEGMGVYHPYGSGS
ncbi:MAG: hypothetical protein HYV29_07095 [Ignavibacteriales bacterium]|nr:hypothetical protein [Ignavibacteriales bacterium]